MAERLADERIGTCTVEEARAGSGVPIEVVTDRETMAVVFARTVLDHVREANEAGRRFVAIMPVGPTGQWQQMADIAAREHLDLSRFSIVQMDEYLAADGRRVPATDPFSFTGFVRETFGRKAARECGFDDANWVIPDPADPGTVDRAIASWGGVDVAYAGIGLNGHLAFNEPPLASGAWTDASFAQSPTRIVKLAETTKATNSIFGTGGDLGSVPDYAVSIGMRQILGARSVHVFLDWAWQRFVWRRALLGPVSRSFPASLLQPHADVRFTMTEDVAQVHSLVPE